MSALGPAGVLDFPVLYRAPEEGLRKLAAKLGVELPPMGNLRSWKQQVADLIEEAVIEDRLRHRLVHVLDTFPEQRDRDGAPLPFVPPTPAPPPVMRRRVVEVSGRPPMFRPRRW